MKRFFAAAFILSLLSVCQTQAAVIVTASEVSGDVIFDASGALNLAALSEGSVSGIGLIAPSSPAIIVGNATQGGADLYTGTFTAPDPFGNGGVAFADTGFGGLVGFSVGSQGPNLIVPDGYISEGNISTSSTYLSSTFDSLGLEEGTYVWSWGTGDDFDSFTLVIPEPGSLALLALSGLLALRRQDAGRLCR